VQHAVFRGDSVWTAITTVRNWGAGNRASIQWFQIRAAASALIQQGVFGTRDAHYFYPAGCPDNNGNFVMVCSRSGQNEFGSIGFTGRKATDPLGTLQASALFKSGGAHYQALDSGGRNRWGDFGNGVASDPGNPRIVWFYSEFASAANTWATWVGSRSSDRFLEILQGCRRRAVAASPGHSPAATRASGAKAVGRSSRATSRRRGSAAPGQAEIPARDGIDRVRVPRRRRTLLAEPRVSPRSADSSAPPHALLPGAPLARQALLPNQRVRQHDRADQDEHGCSHRCGERRGGNAGSSVGGVLGA
jgi:hypothetical protein